MAKVIHERDICIGCGACAAVCPAHWEMADDGKVNLKKAKKAGKTFVLELKDVGCCKEAADSCPVQCIKVQ